MKVLQLIPDTLENPSGGMGEQCRQIAKHLSCSYTIIGSEKQEPTTYGDNKIYLPAETVSLPLGMPDPHLYNMLHQNAITAKAAMLPKHDVIHAFDWNCFYPGAIIAKHWGVPLVITIQLSISQLNKNFAPLEWPPLGDMLIGMELLGLTNAKAIIHVSKSYAHRFPEHFDSKSYIIPNGIDNKEWERDIPYKLPGKNKLKVVYLGRMAYQKGIHILLESKIPKEMDLIFIGGERGANPELISRIRSLAAQEENIYYLGALYGQEKIGALQAADAVIMPSIHEPFGIVALEALASKSILLSSFIDGMGDFLTEDIAINCGMIPSSIEASLDRLLKMTEEEKTARKLAGAKLCEYYDWSELSQKVEQVYRSCLDSN